VHPKQVCHSFGSQNLAEEVYVLEIIAASSLVQRSQQSRQIYKQMRLIMCKELKTGRAKEKCCSLPSLGRDVIFTTTSSRTIVSNVLQIYFNGPSIHGEKQTNPVKISFRLPSPLNPNFDRPKLNGRIVLAVFTH
jgi:hypothetical protein